MARKLDIPDDVNTPAPSAAPLAITQWDEGGATTHGWLGVEIIHRRGRSQDSGQRQPWAPMRAVMDYCDDLDRR
jgi:hypothetical protein